MKKYLLYSLLTVCFGVSFIACSKDTTLAETRLTQKMIEDKAWFLDYTQTGTVTKTYVGQATYYINFLKNGTTHDSDGLDGTYRVDKVNGQLQIFVQAKTTNGTPIEYSYTINSVGTAHLILSYSLSGKITQLYYTSKR